MAYTPRPRAGSVCVHRHTHHKAQRWPTTIQVNKPKATDQGFSCYIQFRSKFNWACWSTQHSPGVRISLRVKKAKVLLAGHKTAHDQPPDPHHVSTAPSLCLKHSKHIRARGCSGRSLHPEHPYCTYLMACALSCSLSKHHLLNKAFPDLPHPALSAPYHHPCFILSRALITIWHSLPILLPYIS